MAVILPTSEAPAAAWQLVDFINVPLRSDAAAGGRAVVFAGQLDPGTELWLIDHMVCQTDSTTKTTLRLYDGYEDPLRIIDGTANGNFNVADWPAGLQVTTELVAVWVGASNGARGVLTLQGRRMLKG